MLAGPLQAGSQPQKLSLRPTGQGHHRRELRLALGERAGLVHHQRVNLFQNLQGLGVLDEHTGSGAAAGSDHDGHRRRQSQRARAGDDEHRHRAHESVGQARLRPDQRPDDESNHSHQHHRRNEVGGHHVGQALDGGAAALGFADQADDVGQQRLAAHALGPHDEAAGAVDGAAGDVVALDFLHRDGFARDHGLVHRAVAVQDHAVHGNLLARANPEAVAGLDVLQRNVDFGAVVANYAGGLGRQAQESFDGATGLAAGAEFEHLSQKHQGDDDGGGFKVHRHFAAFSAEGIREEARSESGHYAVEISRAGAESDEGEHVQAAVDDRGPAALEKRPTAPEHHRGGEGELNPNQRQPGQESGKRLARNHLRHGEEEDRSGKDNAGPKPASHVQQLRVGLFFHRCSPRLQGHPANGARARLAAHHLRVHGADVFCFGQRSRNRQRLQRHAALGTRARPRLADFRIHGTGVVGAIASQLGRPQRNKRCAGRRGTAQVPGRLGAKLLQAAGITEEVRRPFVLVLAGG